jgi:pSer/pThr/pTyr-binding forkhead associated (FHA) protein
MPFQLTVIAGPDRGRTFALNAGAPLIVGRGKTTPTQLVDPHVSRQHCRVQLQGDKVVVVDAGSVAGTFVNGTRVSEQALQSGDIIQVGETQLRLELPGLADQSTLPPAAAPPKQPVTRAAAAPLTRAAPAVPEAPALPADRIQELSGTRLARYEVGAPLARGRSGLVFLARDSSDGQQVALKVLWPEFSKDEAEVKRFVRAMKTMIPIRHPHLVSVLNAGRTGPYCWIAMEYLEGESVAQALQRTASGKPQDWRSALRVAVHVSRALVFAHYHQIIHRDISPQNILIRSQDQFVKLGDLMLAKATEGALAQQITRPGEILGDFRYMSPERTAGGSVPVDGRADLYSLGATTYALLTGRPPLEGDSPVRTILKIRQEKPVSPNQAQPGMPPRLEAAVMKLLAKDPGQRFQTAAELLGELEGIARAQKVAV